MILYWRDTKNGNMKYNGPPRQGVIEVHHHLLVVKLTYHAGQLGLLRIGKRKDQPFLQRQVSAKLRPGHVLHIAGIVLAKAIFRRYTKRSGITGLESKQYLFKTR